MNGTGFRRWSLLGLMLCAIGAVVAVNAEQVVVSEPLQSGQSDDLEAFKQRVEANHPGMELVGVSGQMQAVLKPVPKPSAARVAVFVRNQSTVRELDDEVDAIRETIAADLAGGGVTVLDKADIGDAFHQWKMQTGELKAREMNVEDSISAVFSGGSPVQMAKIIGADYLLLASLGRADARARALPGGESATTFSASMNIKILDATGASTYGDVIKKVYPVTGVSVQDSATAATYYRDLFEDAAAEAAQGVVKNRGRWEREVAAQPLVTFSVRTTIDGLIDGLENGVRAANDVLDELRHNVGGVTVDLDGAVVGSAPGKFQATPGLHQLRISRQWMIPWQRAVNIQEGSEFNVALELSDAGLQRFTTMEGFRAAAAVSYAEAAYRKNIKINFDTAGWRDVASQSETTVNESSSTSVNVVP